MEKKVKFGIGCNLCNEEFITNPNQDFGDIEQALIKNNWSIINFEFKNISSRFYLCPKCTKHFLVKFVFNY